MTDYLLNSRQDECRVFWNGTNWVFDFAHHETIPGYVVNTIFQSGYAMIFRNIDIPKNSTIIEAYVTFTTSGPTDKDIVRTRIEGERNPDPLPFSDLADYQGRPRTSAQITWDNIQHWAINTQYQTPDFKSVIQEIINLPNWQTGKAVCLFWQDHEGRSTPNDYTTRMADTYHHDPLRAPVLTIKYVPFPLVIGRWACTDLQYTQIHGQIDVVATSDVPCHLWLRYSKKKLLKHRISRIRRGLVTMGDTYLCFSVYNDIEQRELGDTLTHTFELRFFDEVTFKRQTIYFYLWGEIGAILSPSQSAVFTHIYQRKYEEYWPALDSALGLSNGWLTSQSFTVRYPHHLSKIHAYLAHRYDPCTIHAYIFNAAPDHTPTGDLLASGAYEIKNYHGIRVFFEAKILLDTPHPPPAGIWLGEHLMYDIQGSYEIRNQQTAFQSFEPQQDLELYALEVHARKNFLPSDLEVALQKTGAGGIPDGTDIMVASVPNVLFPIFTADWIPIYFNAMASLLKNVRYALVFRALGCAPFCSYILTADRVWAQYKRGRLGWSVDGGTTWSQPVGEDFLFKLWCHSDEKPIPIPHPRLLPEREYCIVLTQRPEAPGETQWRGTTSGTYTGGMASLHGILPYWYPIPAFDLNFSEWGWPPE